MKYIFTVLITILIIQTTYSQIAKYSKASIDNVDFLISGDQKLLITYDIIGGKSKDKFDITFFVVKENGKRFNPTTATGDLKNVSRGTGKTIYYDIGKDIVYIDEKIYIEVEAEHINPKIIPYISKSKAMLYSSLFPGIGSAKLGRNKIHLLKGLVGYACIGLSVKYNMDAVTAFENYKTENDGARRNDYITEAENNLNMSNYLMYGAAAVWFVDYINVLLMNNKTKKNNENISFTPSYDPVNGGTTVTLKWEF